MRDLAIRDSAEGTFYLGLKALNEAVTDNYTIGGVRLIDQSVVELQATTTGSRAWVALPGRPDCPLLEQPIPDPAGVGVFNCRCDFVVTVRIPGAAPAPDDRCSIPFVVNCLMCGAQSPESHQSDVECTQDGSVDAGL